MSDHGKNTHVRSDAATDLLANLANIDMAGAKITHMSIDSGREYGPKSDRDKTHVHISLTLPKNAKKKADKKSAKQSEDKGDKEKDDVQSIARKAKEDEAVMKLAKKIRDKMKNGDDISDDEKSALPEMIQKILGL